MTFFEETSVSPANNAIACENTTAAVKAIFILIRCDFGPFLVDGHYFDIFHIFHNHSQYYSPEPSIAFRYGGRANVSAYRRISGSAFLGWGLTGPRESTWRLKPLSLEFKPDGCDLTTGNGDCEIQTGSQEFPCPWAGEECFIASIRPPKTPYNDALHSRDPECTCQRRMKATLLSRATYPPSEKRRHVDTFSNPRHTQKQR
jgi:hypothetical protein